MRERIEKLQELLAREKLDAIWLSDPISRYYMTGFHSSAGVVFITRREAYFYTDFRYIDAARERVQGFNVTMSTQESPATTEVKVLLEKYAVKKIGYEADRTTVSYRESVESKLGTKFVSAENILLEMRAVKSEEETAKMIAAQRIAEKALNAVLGGVLRAGMTEKQLAAEIIYLLYKNGADKLSFDPIVVAGPNSALPHGEPGERPIQRGDFVTMDFGCIYDGYCSDMTRTVAVGSADDEMRNVYDIVLKAQLAGIAQARAGVTGNSIDGVARKVISDAGFGEYFGHGFGHGIGLEVHEPPNANRSNEKPLPYGAVISAEPGIYLPGKFGVRIEDVVRLTEQGNINFMNAPKDLIII